VFKQKGDDLGALRGAFPLAPGQSGAVFALGPDRLCLDYVSLPEAFTRLYGKLLDGYLLDAIERLDGKPATEADLSAFVAGVESAHRSRRRSAGLGEDVRMRGPGLVGSALELTKEVVQECVFSTEPDRVGPQTWIARPSERS
jgi:hypothetical protein